MELFTNRNMVCQLLKAFYELKHISRWWYKKLFNFFLKKLGLQQININHNIYISSAEIIDLIVNIFVNDIKIIIVKNF